MSVKVNIKQAETEKGTIINFNSEDHVAVEGLKGSFFEGKVKAIHKVHAAKLVKNKLAKEHSAQVVKEENKKRASKDI